MTTARMKADKALGFCRGSGGEGEEALYLHFFIYSLIHLFDFIWRKNNLGILL